MPHKDPEAKREYFRAYRQKHREKLNATSRRSYAKNGETSRARARERYADNPEAQENASKEWRSKNPERARESARRAGRKWREANLEKARTASTRYKAKRFNTDPCFKLQCLLRSRLLLALKGNAKRGSAVKLLGCTIEELKLHLEKQFQPGMTWENHALDGWHIDHIKPLSKFDLTDPVQLAEACRHTNLQPLWAKDNLSKGDKAL